MFSRITTIIRAQVSAVIDKFEDPAKSIRLMVEDMKKDLAASHRRVAQSMAQEVKLRRQRDEHQAESKKWEQRAMAALQAGREKLAKIALTHKQEHDQYVETFNKEIISQNNAVSSMKRDLQHLQLKTNQAQRRETILIARANRSDTRLTLQRSIGNPKSIDLFGKMEQRILDREAEIEANGNPQAVDEVWTEIDNLSTIEHELSELKNRLSPEVT